MGVILWHVLWLLLLSLLHSVVGPRDSEAASKTGDNGFDQEPIETDANDDGLVVGFIGQYWCCGQLNEDDDDLDDDDDN